LGFEKLKNSNNAWFDESKCVLSQVREKESTAFGFTFLHESLGS